MQGINDSNMVWRYIVLNYNNQEPQNSIGNYLGAPSQIDLVGLMALGFRRDDLGF